MIPDFSPLTVSPTSKSFSFKFTIPTASVPDFSITATTVLLLRPVSFSPIIKSALLEFGPEKPLKVIDGKSGSDVSFDSKTPNNWAASGTFKLIFSSWTLVPKTLLNDNPSFSVFVPIPEDVNVDLFKIKTFASFNFFCLLVTFDFKTVAKRLAFTSFWLNPTKVTVFLSSAISTWSLVKGSIAPFSYDKKYLSSSNGWKNKFLPAFGVVKEFWATVISEYCFLTRTVVFVTSILSTKGLSKGVSKLFSPIVNDGFLICKSFTSRVVAALPSWTPPPQTPVTVGIPTTWISLPSVETPTIRLKRGVVSPGTV